jgi:hypothetical protein
MLNSYRTVIERLRQFADGHFILKKFYHGQIDAADLDKEPMYPLMHVICNEISPSEGILDYQLSVRFADIGRDKEDKTEHQKEIISDMNRIALHLISEVQNGQILFGDDAEIVDQRASILPFAEEFMHRLTGVQLDFTLRLPYDWSACDIPADYSPNISDNPEVGGGVLTKIGVYNDGDFVGYTSFLDFSDDFIATVNGNKIEIVFNGSAGGGSLQDVTDVGNTTTNDIELIDAAEVKFGAGGGVLLDNGSRLREGTIDADTGGYKGIAQICGVGYELKWEAGSQYVMNGNGDSIREVNYKFNIVPTANDDITKGYYVTSRWVLDNGDIYVCTDNTESAAVWEVETYSDWNATSGSKEILNKPDLSGFGDMFKSTYDTDNDGIVDSAETIQIVVRNSTGVTLTKGQVVYLSGATGNRPNAVLAQANTEATSSKTIGIVVADITNNSDGQVAVSGTLHNLNTSAFTAGDAVWLSATTAGAFTATPPAEPNHTVFIGYIARAHPTLGRIVLAIQNGYELNELHGVTVSSPTNNQGLIYNSTSGLWENQNIPSADWGVLSLTETSARYDNYAPTGWDDEKVISINANYTDKIQVYSGIAGGYAGRMVTILNSSSDNLMILEKNSTNSSAANRMRFQGRSAYFLFPSEQITLLHNGTDWGVLSSDSNNGHMAFDDMLGAPNAASPTTYFGETGIGIASGTGAFIRNDNQILNGLGTITFSTGTVANNSGTLKAMGRSGFFTSAGSFSKYCVVSRIRLEQLPTAAQDFIFGVGISSSSNTTGLSVTGSMTWYASFANSFWRNYSSNTAGTLITDTTTSLAVTTNAVVLGTYHPNNLGDCVFFYSADGGMTYAVSSRFVRVSNNYAGAPVIGVNKLAGLTSIQATVDYVGITCKGGVI